jgi:hypothetical protein
MARNPLTEMDRAGLYIVALSNENPISVNAHDPRIAQRCIMVNREHCKFGKARNLRLRERNYVKCFGAAFVDFRPIALLDDIERAESLVLAQLSAWRVRGTTGRRNEWLQGITPVEVERIAISLLARSDIVFMRSRCGFDPESPPEI